jgi:hypothetical protein
MIFFLLWRDLLPPLARGTCAAPFRFFGFDVGSIELFVRYQFADISRFHRRYCSRPPQFSLAFFSLARKQVAFETFVPFNLSAARYSESLGCGSIGLYLRHLILLLSSFVQSCLLILA